MPTISLDQKTIFYQEAAGGAASAPPLVLLHGFPLDSRVWDAQLSALGGARRVIAPDLPGFGQTKSEEPFTIATLAEQVHRLLEKLGALPCVLAGLSMGGYVALAYAKKYPADLTALVLVDTRAEADSTEGKQGRQKMIELVRASGSKAVAEQMLPKMLAGGAESARPELARRLREIMQACPALTIEHALEAMRDREDSVSGLASIPVPTLVVVGESDAITPPAMAEVMHRNIPKSTLASIRGAGHMSPIEQPEQVNEALRRFLDGLPAA